MKKHLPILIFVVIYTFIALKTYTDFGVTTDEPLEYESVVALNNFFKKPVSYEDTIKSLYKRPEDVLKQVPLLSQYFRAYMLPHVWLSGTHDYDKHHLINMLASLPAFVVIYYTLLSFYKKSGLAILGPLFLVLEPHLLGHIAANPKDAPFALMYITALCTIYLSTKIKNNYIRILCLGVVFWLTQSIRVIGFTIYIIYALYLLYLHLQKKQQLTYNQVYEALLILIVACFLMLLTWPYLGTNFVSNMRNILINATTFTDWNGTMLYNGIYITAQQRPWHYLPVLLSITTPLIYLALLLIGTLRLKRLFRNDLFFIFYVTFIVNLLAYFALQPIIYNGIRHYLFLQGVVAIIAAIVFVDLLLTVTNFKIKLGIITITVIYFAMLTRTLIILHPYQYIYFNELIGGIKGAQGKYELDYWLTSRREAINWILANQDMKKEIIYSTGAANYYAKDADTITREPAYATITVCDEKREISEGIRGSLLYQVKRYGVPLINVRRMEKVQ